MVRPPAFLEVKYFRKNVSRLASLANKRLDRIEKNKLTDSPAYQRWIREGGERFSVRGKDYNQLQKELSRLRNFIDSKTSTIRGINNNLKEIAKNTGLKYVNLKDLRSKSKKFFELSSKVEQYLRNVEDIASAIGYHKIWEVINKYVSKEKIDLSNTNIDIDQLTDEITKLLTIGNDGDLYQISNDWFMLT